MASYHLTVKNHSRSKNANAVALASYRSGERLWDERQMLHKDCRKNDKSEVLHSELFNSYRMNREQLWNAAEAAENRKNSVVAREIEIALPVDISNVQKVSLARDFCKELVARYRCAIDLAVHAPDADGDQRNYHAHILMTTREVEAGGMGIKWRQLNQPNGAGRIELAELRKKFELLQNGYLERAGVQERVSCGRASEMDIPKKYVALPFSKYQVMRREGRVEEYKEVSGYEEFVRWKSRKELEIEDLAGELELAKMTNRQYEEDQNAIKKNSRREGAHREADGSQMVTQRTEHINRPEVERRAEQDSESNRQLEKRHQRTQGRQRGSLGGTEEIERSIGKAEQLQPDGLQSVSRALEERNRNTERLQEEFARDYQDISELLRRTKESCEEIQCGLEGELSRADKRVSGGSIRKPERTRVRDQLSLGDFKLPEGKIKSCLDRERRENPRMGQGIGGVAKRVRSRTESIGDGFRKSVERTKRGIERVQNQLKRCVKVASECFRRYGTALLSLADKVKEEIPKQERLKEFEGSLVKEPGQKSPRQRMDSATLQRVLERKHALKASKKITPEKPPKYICPGLEEARQKKKELERSFLKQETQQKRDEPERGRSIGW